MASAKVIHPQYVTDASGRQTAVIIPLEEYHALLEDLDDLARAAKRVDEPVIPYDQVVSELRKDGLL